MRAVIVTTSYPVGPEDPAGHFVRTEALRLVAQGVDVHVVAPAGSGGLLADDVGVRAWPIVHGGAFGWPGAASRLRARPWRAVGVAAFVRLAVKRIQDLRPDHVVAHWLVPSVHPIASSCPLARDVEAVAHGADVRMLLALPAPLRIRWMKRVIETASTIRFVARSSLDALSSGLPRGQRELLARRARVHPAALSVPDVAADAKALRTALGGRRLAVTVSRLIASKRVDLAIRAVHRLRPNVALRVVGDGPDRSRLSGLAGAESALFEGTLPRKRALAWMAAADVLVHPSFAEGAPTVIREARLVGTPVVACAAGDVARWAREDSGIVVVEPDVASIATAIDRLIGDGPHQACSPLREPRVHLWRS